MKAIIVSAFGDENVLQYKDAPMPEPGPGEVRVRLGAAGVNPVETYIRAGQYGTLPKLPYIPGNDGAGVIDALGSGAQGFERGQRVFVAANLAKRNTGTYAEFVVCDAAAVRTLPDGVSYIQGAGLGTPGLAAACALFAKAKLRPGERVLIHGATGGVGTLAVQLARQAGAVVFGTAGTLEGETLLKDIGAHGVFNHREEGYLERIREASGGGPDVIIEMLANVNLAKDLSVLATGGRIVVVGNRGSLEFNPRDAMSKDAAIHGLLTTNMSAKIFDENMFRLTAALENGLHVVLRVDLPLVLAPMAHRAVAEDGKTGKVVLLCGPV